jgi:hypothetical protein
MKRRAEYRCRGESEGIQKMILDIFAEVGPRMTVRQIYYALTVRDGVSKTEAGYRQTIYQLKQMREREILPYSWIADNTRWQIKPDTAPSLGAALFRMQKAYRRDFWATQLEYVELWVEKDALAGVISPITQEYDVPLYVARGYGSLTVLYDAAEDIKQIGKPAFIYHFGDFDPSGVDASYKIRDGLMKHGADITFERIAVTSSQIEALNLPTRATKPQDPRSKKWGDHPSVELDALPVQVLRTLVERCIKKHIDKDEWERMRQVEEAERNTMANINNLVLDQNYSDKHRPQ